MAVFAPDLDPGTFTGVERNQSSVVGSIIHVGSYRSSRIQIDITDSVKNEIYISKKKFLLIYSDSPYYNFLTDAKTVIHYNYDI